MESTDLQKRNIEKIGELFPNVIIETIDNNGQLKKTIDFEKLKLLLDGEITVGNEKYEFVWPGKTEAIREAYRLTRNTLNPILEKSLSWDSTENIYIEGDNLEVLKLIQESYLGKVKMIYIDPPYNTGGDLIYRDDFTKSVYDYEIELKTSDEESGERLLKNTDSNGRFHSDWCSMIYPRLLLSRNLLTDDGVIFISIDDHEQDNLRKICDEIFGRSNFIGQFVWQRRTSPDMRKRVSTAHDYIVCYAKDITSINSAINKVRLSEKDSSNYKNPDGDPRGPWASSDFTAQGYRPNQMYEIVTPGGSHYFPPEGRCWKNIESEFLDQYKEGRMWFGKDGKGIPRRKTYLSEREGKNVWTWWPNSEVGHSQEATQEVKALFDGHMVFDYPKPVRLLKKLIQIGTHSDSIVLDFFSGSATTAHALIDMNAEDGGNRKFILIQIPENIEADTDAGKKGYETICQIAEERIRLAGSKIKLEKNINGNVLDTGFRVLKLRSSNMKDIYYSPDNYQQDLLSMSESNIKQDRTDLDLLFGCLLDWGLELSKPYKSEEIAGVAVHTYDEDALVACFAENVPEEVIREIAKRQPLRAVFRDSSFGDDAARVNLGEIFKLLSPDTEVKVL